MIVITKEKTANALREKYRPRSGRTNRQAGHTLWGVYRGRCCAGIDSNPARLKECLQALHAAMCIEDMELPGFRLHPFNQIGNDWPYGVKRFYKKRDMLIWESTENKKLIAKIRL